MMLSETIEQLATTTQTTGRSYQTAQSYREKLSHLCDFLGDVPIEDITTADLWRYVAHLQDCGFSPAAIAIRVRALKRLWSFVEAVGIIEENPARRIRALHQRREVPEGAETDDILTSLEITQKSNPLDLRDQAIIRSVHKGDLEAVARILGHSSVEVTKSHYDAFMPNEAK